jgi:Flp pilus assembly protein TadD
MLGACAQTSDLLGPSTSVADASAPPAATATAAGDKATDQQNELQKATAYWGQQFAKSPSDLKSALSYARNLKALGEKQKALSVLQQAAVFHDGDPELAGEYGRLALEMDQLAAAAKLLEVADNPAKPDWKVISARGTLLAKQGNYKDAIPFYERALTLSQDQPSVLNNLAMAYAMSGEAKKAEDILRKASNAPGASEKVHQNLALVLGLQGRYDEAKAEGGKGGTSDSVDSNTDYIRKMVKLDPIKSPAGIAPAAVAATTTPAAPKTAVAQGDAYRPPAAGQAAVQAPAQFPAQAQADAASDAFKTTVKKANTTAAAAIKPAAQKLANTLKPGSPDAPLDPETGWNTAVASTQKAAAPLFKGSSQ